MIKTLRITTVIAAILAVGFLSFPVVFGYHGDEQIEQFLKTPGVIEKFNKAKGAKVSRAGNQTSPLVKQAMAFQLYLNPPPKPVKRTASKPPPVRGKPTVQTPIPQGPVTAKFTLIGTSYYPARPEQSWAYINEPGKGLHWVKQGSKVSHLVIDQVKDGSIVVKDREETVTLVAVRQPRRSLIKGENTSKSTTALPGASATITSSAPGQVSAAETAASASTSAKPPVSVTGGILSQVDAKRAEARRIAEAKRRAYTGRNRPPVPGRPSSTVVSNRRPQTPPNPAELALMEKLAAEMSAVETGTGSGTGSNSDTKGEALLDKFISDLKAMRITSDEASKLNRIGEKLENQQDSDRPSSPKLQRSRGLRLPTKPQPPQRPPRPPR